MLEVDALVMICCALREELNKWIPLQTHTILFILWNPKQKILAGLFHTMKAKDETVTA